MAAGLVETSWPAVTAACGPGLGVLSVALNWLAYQPRSAPRSPPLQVKITIWKDVEYYCFCKMQGCEDTLASPLDRSKPGLRTKKCIRLEVYACNFQEPKIRFSGFAGEGRYCKSAKAIDTATAIPVYHCPHDLCSFLPGNACKDMQWELTIPGGRLYCDSGTASSWILGGMILFRWLPGPKVSRTACWTAWESSSPSMLSSSSSYEPSEPSLSLTLAKMASTSEADSDSPSEGGDSALVSKGLPYRRSASESCHAKMDFGVRIDRCTHPHKMLRELSFSA